MALPVSPPALVPHAAGGPCARLLSNGALTSLVTAEGTGFTQLDWRRITSWTPDPVEDREGLFLYLRDEEDGALWSLGREPVAGAPDRYHVRSEPGLLRIERSERGIEAVCEIAVGADRHAELRRIRLRNAGARPRRLSLTSYVGVVLHHPGGHAGHPGFSKLFVQTSVDAAAGVLFARRRPRGSAPEPLHFAHAVFGPGAASFETDRARFVGRGRSLASPAALDPGASLSGSIGNVLDPIASWRRELTLAPGETLELLGVIALAENEADARALALEMAAPGAFDAVRDGAERRARAERDRCGLAPEQAAYLEALLAQMLYGVAALRAPGGGLPARAGNAGRSLHVRDSARRPARRDRGRARGRSARARARDGDRVLVGLRIRGARARPRRRRAGERGDRRGEERRRSPCSRLGAGVCTPRAARLVAQSRGRGAGVQARPRLSESSTRRGAAAARGAACVSRTASAASPPTAAST